MNANLEFKESGGNVDFLSITDDFISEWQWTLEEEKAYLFSLLIVAKLAQQQ